MRRNSKLVLMSLLLSSLKVMAGDTVSVVRMPLKINTKIETGQLVKGEASGVSTDPSGSLLSQIGVGLMQEVVVDQRLDIKVGVGGVFYYSYPVALGNAAGLGTKFGPGISQAQAMYKLGDVTNPLATLRVGYFPFKYNPDAKNLGEYLFRSGAYPTYIFTGGWAITDNAFIKLQGIEASFSSFNGTWKNDFLLTFERDNRPTGDVTPSYVTEVNMGPFQFGGGVAFYHYLPIRPSQESPGTPANTYYEFNNLPAGTVLKNPSNANDSIVLASDQNIVVNGNDMSNFLAAALFPDSGANAVNATLNQYHPSVNTYTFKAIKLMARASFNLQTFHKMDFLGPQDMKVYSEIAVLGLQNYPGLYDDRSNRMPIMAGVNLPTFKLLDILSLEVEYLNSPNPDDLYQMQLNQQPDYSSNKGGTQTGDFSVLFRDPNGNKRDDWKWSLYASKQLIKGFSLVTQVANDHYRPIDTFNAGLWSGAPLLRSPKDWYYVVSINFGI